VVTNLAYDNIIADLSEVLNTLSPKEVEVRTAHDDWYNMRILPYRTMENRIDGAVLTFAAIGDQKKTHATLESSRHKMELALELVRHAFDMNPDPIAVLDSQGRIVIANTQLSELFGIAQNKVNDMDFLSVLPGTFDAIDLKSELKTALRKGKGFSTRLVELKSPEGSQHSLSMAGLSRAAMTTPIAFFCIL
jgi:two-component system CheB/CheR fusion protein